MRQYFYLVAHMVVGDDLYIDKIFLQEHDAIRWGKVLATKNPDYSVSLYRQEIARTAMVKFVKYLEGYSPYCPQCSVMPRTFFNGEQFQCPNCGWVSQFPEDFIERYKNKWKIK